MRRIDKKLTIIHIEDNNLILSNMGKFYSITGEKKDSLLSYFKGELMSDEILLKHNDLAKWFLDKEQDEIKRSYVITTHPEIIILSRQGLCHECILRWLPRSRKLDEYNDYYSGNKGTVLQVGELSHDDLNWDIDELEELLSLYPVCIVDYDNNLKAFDLSPLPHPECLNECHHFQEDDQIQTEISLSELPIFSKEDIALQLTSEEKLPNTYYHEVAVINAPSKVDPDVQLAGRGIAKNKILAQKKAIVEAVERFHAWAPYKNLEYGSAKDLSDRIVNMNDAFLFGSDQYNEVPFTAYNSLDERWWVSGSNITFPNRKLIPLDFIQLESSSNISKPLYHQSSTGMAGHTSINKCIEAAVLEVIERAAQYHFWVNKQFAKLEFSNFLNIGSVSALINDLNDKDVETHFWSVSISRLLPETIICCLKFKDKFVFSSACNFETNLAIERALTEAYTEYLHAVELLKEGVQRPLSINQPIDHLTYYLNPSREAIDIIDDYFSIEFNHIPTNVEEQYLLDYFKDNNMDVFVLHRESKMSKRLGVHIVHVFIPQLPSLGFKFETLRIPQADTKKSIDLSVLNKIPHPFG